jgi:nucleoside-diphosphate-sugar epimerase
MKIFVTGAGGFIGGSVAMRLRAQGHQILGLVRNDVAANRLAQSGIEPVMGTLDDADLLIQQARSCDAVINTANADHLGSVQALLEGLKGSGKPLLHTSGSSVVGDDARGAYCSLHVFDEQTPWVINPFKQARRDIDMLVLSGVNDGVKTAVICPSLIYGVGTGLNPHSVQIPFLASNAREKGAVEIVGKGLNVWSNVHIEDVASLYQLVLEKGPGGAFYFVENGEASYAELAAALAQRLGLRDVVHLEPEAAAERWGVARAYFSFGSNSRVRARRAHEELGWAPRHSSVFNWIANEAQF